MAFYASVTESRWWEQSRKDVEGMALRQRQSANSGLMETFYDCVAELDSNLQIVVADNTGLSRFLRFGPPDSLQGVSFAELVAHAEDRERFLEHMLRPVGSHQETMTEMLRVALKCGNGHSLRV